MRDERAAAIVEAWIRGPATRPIADVLVRSFNEWIPGPGVIAAAYANDPDGGPDNATASVTVMVSRLRRRLARHGLVIDGRKHWGYRMRWRE